MSHDTEQSSYHPSYDPTAEVVDLCRDLIRIDTTNFGDDSGPGERKAAEYVAGLLEEVGIEARPGLDSTSRVPIPTSSSSPATYSAAFRSPGPESSPKLVVSIRIRSRHRVTTSFPTAFAAPSSAIPRACHGPRPARLCRCGSEGGPVLKFPAHSSGWRNWQTR